MKTTEEIKYQKASKRVKAIKDWYGHLLIFVLVVPIVYFGRFYALPQLGIISEEKGFNNWLNWNTYIFPAIWLFVIGVQGLMLVFSPKIEAWEDKKNNRNTQ